MPAFGKSFLKMITICSSPPYSVGQLLVPLFWPRGINCDHFQKRETKRWHSFLKGPKMITALFEGLKIFKPINIMNYRITDFMQFSQFFYIYHQCSKLISSNSFNALPTLPIIMNLHILKLILVHCSLLELQYLTTACNIVKI
jgi:hypothetical protein